MINDLSTVVSAAMTQHVPEARRVLVAVSGGADSVAALFAVVAMARQRGDGFEVLAAHFDHNLRPGSGDDAAFVRALCAEHGIGYHEESANVAEVARARGWNLEDAGRRLRYANLFRVARDIEADVVATGHTLDDQAETVLMQLLRGAAMPTGIAVRRGRLVRPLLGVTHAQALAYVAAGGWGHREDASNRDQTRTRAWLRLSVLPLLEERVPDVRRRLAASAEAARDAREAIDQMARLRFGEAPLSTAALLRAPRALRLVAIARLLATAGAAIDRQRLLEVDARLSTRTPWRLQLGPGRSLRIAYGTVAVVPDGTTAGRAKRDPAADDAGDPTRHPARVPASASERGPAVEPEQVVTWPEALPKGVTPSVLDDGALVLRRRLPGDRIRLPGGTKRLSDLLIDRKVPREERDALAVLARGSEVLWVEGLAVAVGAGTLPEDEDVRWMRVALDEARRAADAGELPVGAAIVRDGRLLAATHNRTEEDADAGAHAEMLAIRRAGEAERDWRLSGATLYVTLEPCPMCWGAVLQTRLARVVYGAENPREGALGSVLDLRAGAWKRRPAVTGGVLAAESASLLRDVFRAKRANSEPATPPDRRAP